jgi:hypothetical protein
MRGTRTERSLGGRRLQVFIGSDPITGNPRQVSRTFKGTKEPAAEALTEFVAEVASGAAMASATTVGEYLARSLDHITPTPSHDRERLQVQRQADCGQARPRSVDRRGAAVSPTAEERPSPIFEDGVGRGLAECPGKHARKALLTASPCRLVARSVLLGL